jgi:hypothetical protein
MVNQTSRALFPHKEGNSEEVRRITIGLPDCVGTEMRIQDDLLDATAARGIIWYN